MLMCKSELSESRERERESIMDRYFGGVYRAWFAIKHGMASDFITSCMNIR